jgi:arsenate reductase
LPKAAAGVQLRRRIRENDAARKERRMANTLYGIRNCDTMKKAWTWMDDHGVAYDFHDYKKQGIDRGRLEAWARQAGWERLLNRAGTTFKKLPEPDKANLDEAKAIGLMLAQPSMIKRPVLELGDRLLVGFKPDEYAQATGT